LRLNVCSEKNRLKAWNCIKFPWLHSDKATNTSGLPFWVVKVAGHCWEPVFAQHCVFYTYLFHLKWVFCDFLWLWRYFH